MKILKSIFQLLGIVCFLFISCKKEDTSVEILQNNKWKIVKWTVNPAVTVGNQSITDATLIIPACQKDDIITFKSDKTIFKDEGTEKCTSTSPQTSVDGNWDLSTDAKSLYLNNTGLTQGQGSIQAVVNKLDDTELNVTISNVTLGNSKTALTLSLLPQ